MQVKLTYFKKNGKFYSIGSFTVPNDQELFHIWEEVQDMQNNGRLPDLVEGATEFIISIDVPEHPYNHPHLIMPGNP